ncbi:MAG: hypothetical protein GY716_00850 [bacterium]|nr:hypothetical protein [bacterium]
MNDTCKKLRDKLAADGPQAIRDCLDSQQHVLECSDCFEFLEALSEIEGALPELPPHDAPDAVVDALLARPELLDEPATLPPRPGIGTWLFRVPRPLALGALGALAITVTLFVTLRSPADRTPFGIDEWPVAASGSDNAPLDEVARLDDDTAEALKSLGYTGEPKERPVGKDKRKAGDRSNRVPPPPASESRKPEPRKSEQRLEVEADQAEAETLARSAREIYEEQKKRDEWMRRQLANEQPSAAAGSGGIQVQVVEDNGPLPGATVTIGHATGYVRTTAALTNARGVVDFPVLRPGRGYDIQVQFPGYGMRRVPDIRVQQGRTTPITIQLADELRGKVVVVAEGDVVDLDGTQSATKFSDEYIQDLPTPGRFYQNVLTLAPGVQDAEGEQVATAHGSRSRDFKAEVGGVGNVDAPTGEFMSRVNPNSIDEMEVVTGGKGVEFSRAQGGFASIVGSPAERFLAERARVEDLEFVSATGYWSNTYVPGDPELRLLQSRLTGFDPAVFASSSGSSPSLHRAIRRAAQPFDAPRNAALDVFLHADRTGITERGRILLQVGLQAAEGHGRRRPAMNLGLVVDLRAPQSDRAAAAARSVVEATIRAIEPGDRIGLTVVGPSSVAYVPPGDFRHGTAKIALDTALAESAGDIGAQHLADAVSTAVRHVSAADDSTATLGSSAVILVAGGALGDVDRLADIAHTGAVAGVITSVIAAGDGADPDSLERLALAGQGNRRILTSPAEASSVVERELAAVGRVVARAVRLRIRLAPGVELVDIPGASSLDEVRAERVREAEVSIDRRLSRNLGIQADRGEDEEGIQIVIPSFYAGDSHVILLDVVAPGPGPVADVTVRYKDLAHLKNGVARDSLGLADESRAAGPLERNVLLNLLALDLAQALEDAGSAAAAGRADAALTRLAEFSELLRELRAQVPDLAQNVELAADIALLDDYRSVLSSEAASRPELLALLSDSLRYAGRLKLQRPYTN